MAGLPSGEAGLDDGTHVVQNNASQLKNRTQENVEAEQRAQLLARGNPLDPAMQFFFGTVMGGFQTLGNFLEMIIQAITGVAHGTINTLSTFVTGLVNDIGNALGWLSDLVDDLWNDVARVIGSIPQTLVSGLTGALNGINNAIQQVIEGIITAIRGIPIVGGGIADLISALTGYREGVENQQVVQQNLTISSTSSVVRQQGWASDYPLSTVTYPAILNSNFGVFADSVGPATAGTDHSHNISSGRDNARAIAAWWSIVQNGSMGGFVTVAEDTVFSKFGLTIYAETAPVPDESVYFEVFREEPDGSLDMLAQSDISSFITRSNQELVLSWTTFRIVARRGERYLLRVRNVSSPSVVPRLRALEYDFGVPGIQWETYSAEVTNKEQYSAAEAYAIAGESYLTPWMMLAAEESDTTEVRTWADDFNRPRLGQKWHQLDSEATSGDLVISNNRLSYGGTVNGFQQAMYIHPLGTDKFKMTAEVSGLAGNGVVAFLCGSGRKNTNGVFLAIGTNDIGIETMVGQTITRRASVTRRNNNGKYTFMHDPASKVYTVLLNDEPIGLSWTDSANILKRGIQFRYFQIQIQRLNGVNAGQVDNWVIQDD